MNDVTLHYNLCAGNSLRAALRTAQELESETGLEPDSISYTNGVIILGLLQTELLRYDRHHADQLLKGLITVEQYIDLCYKDAEPPRLYY